MLNRAMHQCPSIFNFNDQIQPTNLAQQLFRGQGIFCKYLISRIFLTYVEETLIGVKKNKSPIVLFILLSCCCQRWSSLRFSVYMCACSLFQLCTDTYKGAECSSVLKNQQWCHCSLWLACYSLSTRSLHFCQVLCNTQLAVFRDAVTQSNSHVSPQVQPCGNAPHQLHQKGSFYQAAVRCHTFPLCFSSPWPRR